MTTPTRLRNDVRALTTLAERDLSKLWQQVTTAAAAQQALNDTLPALIETYGMAAAALAADWYDEARVKAGVGGSFRAFPIEVRDPGAPVLAGWALSEGKTLDTARVLVAGGVQRRIANAARYTVARSSIADPRAQGWRRVGDGSSCRFCSMLLGRGAVYTEASASFDAHDHCGCSAAPAF
ncbi:hypothetical protein [uncultured Arthrobacter sp.]|uniref:VG15 protein n=1 Tax=uncultured Arthrobacter sp. TaxID=114050 RepID=UPI0025FF689E|nr:hypothetical protein [uncultured Arthrobacter sp.]